MKVFIINEPNTENSIFCYIKNVFNEQEISEIRDYLDNTRGFEDNLNYNRNTVIRKQKWFQTEGKYFCSEWKGRFPRWNGNTYNTTLAYIQEKLLEKLKNFNLEAIGFNMEKFNSCLINKYSDKDYIRAHRDTDKSFGTEPTIIGLSIGSSRRMSFKRVHYNGSNRNLSKKDHKNKYLNFSQDLESGSVFLMGGASQKFWTHEIEKPTLNQGVRYSLTFRNHIL
tara:strand:+ start:4950 stop:5621 length:672 start_codon:yes stop_codon:yes gene_type:complete